MLTNAATLKSFAIVLRTPATCIIKDMPAGRGANNEPRSQAASVLCKKHLNDFDPLKKG